MKRSLLTLIVATSIGTANAGQFWTADKATNTAMVADNVLMLMDWAQTRYIADHPGKFRETGLLEPIIGRHPTSGDVNRGYAGILLTWNAIGYFLPERATTFGLEWNPKKVFWIGSAALDGYTVYDNARIGIKIQF